MTWRQTQAFYACICFTTLLVAGAFASVGFWPVLPFAGFELGLLGACLWLVARRTQQQEVIDVNDDEVRVQKGRRVPQETFQCPRAWARAQVVPPPIRSHPSTLVLASHGREVAIGQFLCEDERHALALRLQRALRGEERAQIA